MSIIENRIQQNGLLQTVWDLANLSTVEEDRRWRRFAIWACRMYPEVFVDDRVRSALDVAERYAAGQAFREEVWQARQDVERLEWDLREIEHPADPALLDGIFYATVAAKSCLWLEAGEVPYAVHGIVYRLLAYRPAREVADGLVRFCEADLS